MTQATPTSSQPHASKRSDPVRRPNSSMPPSSRSQLMRRICPSRGNVDRPNRAEPSRCMEELETPERHGTRTSLRAAGVGSGSRIGGKFKRPSSLGWHPGVRHVVLPIVTVADIARFARTPRRNRASVHRALKSAWRSRDRPSAYIIAADDLLSRWPGGFFRELVSGWLRAGLAVFHDE